MSFITRYSFHWAKLYLRFFITFKFQFSQTESEWQDEQDQLTQHR